jgi:hypothetical protein
VVTVVLLAYAHRRSMAGRIIVYDLPWSVLRDRIVLEEFAHIILVEMSPVYSDQNSPASGFTTSIPQFVAFDGEED